MADIITKIAMKSYSLTEMFDILYRKNTKLPVISPDPGIRKISDRFLQGSFLTSSAATALLANWGKIFLIFIGNITLSIVPQNNPILHWRSF